MTRSQFSIKLVHEQFDNTLFFLQDDKHASIWMKDFKHLETIPQKGNHKNDYLIGVKNLIKFFEEIEAESKNVKLLVEQEKLMYEV